jgi:hypothetical protein
MIRWRVAGLGVLAAVALVLAAFARLRSTWRDAVEPMSLALPLAVAVAVTAGAVPRAAEESAAALAALRAEPYRLPDPDRHGAVFHAIAWPAALALGDGTAVRLVAGVAAASSLLLGYVLFRSAAFEPAAALCGQATLAVVAVVALGPGRALFAHALPQALELLLLAHLVRRLDHLEGARDNAAASSYLLLAQTASALATLEVALLAATAALGEAATGHRRRALRLAVNAALATTVVVLVRALPRLVDWPAQAAPEAPSLSWSPRVLGFVVLSAVVALSLLPGGRRAPRLLAAALVAGLAAVVLGPRTDPALATLPGLALLVPAAAGAPAALWARVTNRWTAPAAPGSRS